MKSWSLPLLKRTAPEVESSNPEAGYMLVAVVVMVALLLLTLSVAAPVLVRSLRREKELESQHRAEQYVRAIRLYYRKTHNYPGSIDALKQTNNVRFLRQEYVDPLTGKNDWRVLHLGEQKTTVKGFFGQELGGINGSSGSAGLGSAAGLASGMGTPIGGGLGASGSSGSTVGATSPLSSGFQGSTLGGSSGSLGSFGSSGSTGSTGSNGIGGGGAVIGVGTARTGASITQPNQQTSYENWEFWYDPRIEQLYQKGQTNMGIGGGSATGLGTGSGSGLGTGFGATGSTTSPFSNGLGTPGSTGGTSAPTTSPQ